MTLEQILQGIQTGVTILSTDAQIAAPVIAVFNPGAAAAISLFAPMATGFVLLGSQLIINWRKDLTLDQMAEAIEASKSVHWPTPPSIEPIAPPA